MTDRASGAPPNPGGTVFISELAREAPVEGAQVLASQLEAHLRQAHAADSFGPGPAHTAPVHPRMIGLTVLRDMRQQRPAVVVYMPASGLTYAAIVRALIIWVFVRPRRFALVVAQLHVGHRSLVALKPLRPLRWAWAVCNQGQQQILRKAAGIRASVLVPRIPETKVSRRSKDDARTDLGLPLHERIYLHVGHARRGRNLHSLAPLAADGHLVVVLSGAFEEEEGALPEGTNITVVRGYVATLADYYRAADVYVFPIADAGSVIGVPMSIVEALANRLPVVAVRSPMVERWSELDGVVLVDDPTEVPHAARQVTNRQVPTSVVPSAAECAGDLITCAVDP